MDQYAQLKDAVSGATDIQSPTSPLGNFPELAKLYQSTFQLPLASAASTAQAANTSTTMENSRAAASAARQKVKDLTDINSYKIVRSKDGGYDFYDPDGNQLDIATVAKRTGAKASDLLKGSENPIDIQYSNDYKNLQDYMNAVVSKDQKKVKQFQQSEPALKNFSDTGGLHKLIDTFKNNYQRYYTPNWGAPNGKTVVPTPGQTFNTGSGSGIGA